MKGSLLAFCCCIGFFINIQFNVIPMHHLFIWSPLACIFMIVFFQKEPIIHPMTGPDGKRTFVKESGEDPFQQVLWFLLIYTVIVATFSASFGLHYIFGLRRWILPS